VDTALVLPGPTGERNTLSFAPRGTVLCSAATIETLLGQLAAVFATANRPVLDAETATLIPAGFPRPLRAALRFLDDIDANETEIHLALVDAACAAAVLPLLSSRDGALVPVVHTDESGLIPLWRLVAERAVCVNTAAAGGNASLMTLAS
jgi:RHH-type proline utilization regulon transcriptional repressor/proline dehydrogenase/delta 1-pyrroline-5-carboxylate dehydrogenase